MTKDDEGKFGLVSFRKGFMTGLAINCGITIGLIAGLNGWFPLANI